MKTARLFLTLALLSALPGCGYLVMSCHNAANWTSRQWSSEKAWRARKWMYADLPNRGSFKAGFKAGYRFANGGYDSCEPPQLRHYWRVGGLTESERQNAQAWSEGFTHGTLAAQQDHAVGQSVLDTAAMQPPPGVPDLRYINPPQNANEMSDGTTIQEGGFPGVAPGGENQYPPMGQAQPQFQAPPQYEQQGMMPGPQFPPQTGQNFQYQPNPGNSPYTPNGGNYEYTPPLVPPPAPASEAAPASSGPLPRGAQLPPPAPSGQPSAAFPFVPSQSMASEGAPGMGGLQTAGGLQPAPPAEVGASFPQQSFMPRRQATQAAEWELPVLRN
jgi:hypothetical protein